jgi:hypothetical protein
MSYINSILEEGARRLLRNVGATRYRNLEGRNLRFITRNFIKQPIPVAARSEAWICGRSLAGIVVSIPPWAWMFVSCECCVLSDRGLCDWPILRPEEFYGACVCVSWSVIRCNNISLYLQWVGRQKSD